MSKTLNFTCKFNGPLKFLHVSLIWFQAEQDNSLLDHFTTYVYPHILSSGYYFSPFCRIILPVTVSLMYELEQGNNSE